MWLDSSHGSQSTEGTLGDSALSYHCCVIVGMLTAKTGSHTGRYSGLYVPDPTILNE